MKFCHQCHALLEEGRLVCLKCGTPRRRGVLAWLGGLLRSLLGMNPSPRHDDDADKTRTMVRHEARSAPDRRTDAAPPRVKPTPLDAIRAAVEALGAEVSVHRSATIRFEDETTGERGEWTSWDAVPEHVKRRILAQGPAHAMIGDLDIQGPDQLVVTDRVTGARRTVQSVDDLPPSLRDVLREVRVDLGLGRVSGSRIIEHQQTVERFSVTGPDGVTRTYDRVEDMPPDVRRQFEQIRRRPG